MNKLLTSTNMMQDSQVDRLVTAPVPSRATELTTPTAVVTTAGVAARVIAKADDKVQLKVTETKQEREAALRLVHQTYCRSGLAASNGNGLRVMKHHLATSTEILIASQSNKVLFTTTLVRDGEVGMPLESLFAEEVAELRSQGAKLAEVSCLATDLGVTDKRHRFELLVEMFSLIAQTARRRGVDRLLLAVHPRHAKAYERMFGCVRVSAVKEYAAVQDNPAVLCVHDFAASDKDRYPFYDRIYGRKLAPWQLDGTRMSDDEREYFAKAISAKVPDMLPMAA